MSLNNIGLGVMITGFFFSLFGILSITGIIEIDYNYFEWTVFSLLFGLISLLFGNGLINYHRSKI